MDVRTCDKCNTPLDGASGCVTCRAQSRGLAMLSRTGYASVREMLDLLEGGGIAAEIEQVPPRRPEERAHPLWNLYAPEAQLPEASALLRRDWSELLEGGEEAARAAERGQRGVDLDAGGEIECPACAHRFLARAGQADCPDCGLALGAPADAAPDEAERP